MSDATLDRAWQRAAELLEENGDLLAARPGDGEPAALAERGWQGFLASLSDDELATIEREGHDADWPSRTPATLQSLIAEARAVSDVGSVATPRPTNRPLARAEKPRKRAQVEAFCDVIVPLAQRAQRVVDVGSGHGHLTRSIAARIDRRVVGLEKSQILVARASHLSGSDLTRSASPAFQPTDFVHERFPILDADCVIGLHACGELSDEMVKVVASTHASLALVGCCLQKRSAPSRPALARAGAARSALDLPTSLLGLSNLTPRSTGVEASLEENLSARTRRLALHALLSRALGPLRLGEEMEGLNRRAAHGELSQLVARAFALRSFAPPSPRAIEGALEEARARHAIARRMALPRSLLARPLEVFVLLDRSLYLAERGFEVRWGSLFPIEVSARNLVLVASR